MKFITSEALNQGATEIEFSINLTDYGVLEDSGYRFRFEQNPKVA